MLADDGVWVIGTNLKKLPKSHECRLSCSARLAELQQRIMKGLMVKRAS
jgi:hypothetical protein